MFYFDQLLKSIDNCDLLFFNLKCLLLEQYSITGILIFCIIFIFGGLTQLKYGTMITENVPIIMSLRNFYHCV